MGVWLILNAVPLDLVGIQVQFEAAAVGVNNGVLRHISVVDHAVLTVGNEGMDFHVIVGGEPLVQNLLTMGSPQDCTVQNTAVFKRVRQTGDVNTAAAAEAIVAYQLLIW